MGKPTINEIFYSYVSLPEGKHNLLANPSVHLWSTEEGFVFDESTVHRVTLVTPNSELSSSDLDQSVTVEGHPM